MDNVTFIKELKAIMQGFLDSLNELEDTEVMEEVEVEVEEEEVVEEVEEPEPVIMPDFNKAPLQMIDYIKKDGAHPFFKVPIAYLSYLDEGRREHYMRKLDVPDRTSLADPKEFETMEKAGINMKFVNQFLDNFTLDGPKKEHDPDMINKFIKNKEGQKKLWGVVKKIPNGKELFDFLARFGLTENVLEDLQTIVNAHTKKPNQYIGG